MWKENADYCDFEDGNVLLEKLIILQKSARTISKKFLIKIQIVLIEYLSRVFVLIWMVLTEKAPHIYKVS